MQIPTYALLLFGQALEGNAQTGIITVGLAGQHQVKLKAWTRIAALVNGLRLAISSGQALSG